MPHGRCNANHIDDEDYGVHKLIVNDRKSLIVMSRHGQIIQPRNETKSEIEHMKGDKEKKNDSRYSLNRVEPISRIGIIQVIRPRLDRNHQTIQRVINERNKNAANLD